MSSMTEALAGRTVLVPRGGAWGERVARLLADLQAVHVGQAEVEDHHVRGGPGDVGQRLLTTVDPGHVVALALQGAHEGEGDVLLVLHDQHPLLHGPNNRTPG